MAPKRPPPWPPGAPLVGRPLAHPLTAEASDAVAGARAAWWDAKRAARRGDLPLAARCLAVAFEDRGLASIYNGALGRGAHPRHCGGRR